MGVSVSSLGLCKNGGKMVLRLILLVGVIAKGVGAVWSVQFVILDVKHSLAGPVLCVAIDFPIGF